MADAIVSQDTSIEGKLTSKTSINVEGEIDGEIYCETLEIAQTANVSGNIRANTVRISGTVRGKIFGDTVTLESTSRVMADIEHRSLSLEQGAEFEGMSRRATGDFDSSPLNLAPAWSVRGERASAPPSAPAGTADEFTTKYFDDVKKYAGSFDQKIVEAIVTYLGKGLLSQRDASLVSCTDPAELNRVRDNFCKKKLGLTVSDTAIDAILADVCKTMSAERNKSRVTFYYLTAEKADALAALR